MGLGLLLRGKARGKHWVPRRAGGSGVALSVTRFLATRLGTLPSKAFLLGPCGVAIVTGSEPEGGFLSKATWTEKRKDGATNP